MTNNKAIQIHVRVYAGVHQNPTGYYLSGSVIWHDGKVAEHFAFNSWESFFVRKFDYSYARVPVTFHIHVIDWRAEFGLAPCACNDCAI